MEKGQEKESEIEEYSSPTGHSFKDKEFSTCFEILWTFLKTMAQYENQELRGFEYMIFHELEKLKNEQTPDLTDHEIWLLMYIREKISGWVIFTPANKPVYVSLTFFKKKYEEWRRMNAF